ncbi:hypothetical protein Tco_0783815 [Tanacetum coccineum]
MKLLEEFSSTKLQIKIFQFLEDKVLFKLDWSLESKIEHHQRSVAFADGSNNDNSRLMEKLEALTIKMDSQFQSLKEEMHEMRKNYNNRGDNHASKNCMNDDTPMCERHEKSLIKLNNDAKQDIEDFKSCIRSMRIVHSKLFDRDDGKTTGDLPNKMSKTVNQEPQPKTDLEKSITKFLDGQRVTNMFVKNNVNDMILKMKQNENNFQTKIKNMERKIDEWSKSQNVSLEQTDRTEPPPPPPPQAHTEQVNAIFTESGKSDDPPKIQKDPPPPIIVNNKIEKDQPIKTTKRDYHTVKTKEYPFRHVSYDSSTQGHAGRVSRSWWLPLVDPKGMTADIERKPPIRILHYIQGCKKKHQRSDTKECHDGIRVLPLQSIHTVIRMVPMLGKIQRDEINKEFGIDLRPSSFISAL